MTPRALALAIVVTLAACTSQADRVQAGLTKAARLAREGQWDKARIETRNVLQMAPRNAKAWAMSARVWEGLGDYPHAWSAWQQSADIDPADVDTQLAIARLRLLSGDTDGAGRDLARVLAAHAQHPGARTLRAAVAARRGDVDGAMRELHALVDGPGAPPTVASLMLASLLAQRDDRIAAVRVLDHALAAAPQDVALLTAAAQVSDADPALAARALDFHRRAALAAPRDLAPRRAWAAFHVRRGEIDQAEAVLRGAGAAEPATLALIDFLAEHRGAMPAQAVASSAIAAHPDTPSLRLRLADLHDADGHPELAERVLRELALRDPASPSALAAQDRLAERAFDHGRPDEALDWLARTLATQPRDATALRLRGRVALAQHRPAAAVVDLRTAVHDAPGNAQAVGLLAQAHRANGEPQLARDVLADAVRFQPDDPALRLLLAADMADAHDLAGADAQLDAAIRQAPRDARAYAAKARLALARGDASAAEKTWRARLAASPDDPDAWLDVAAIRQWRHDPKGALGVFDQGEKAQPANIAIPTARAEWLARQGDPDAAIAAYRTLHERAPGDLSIANNLAWLLAQRADAASLSEALAVAQPLGHTSEPRYLDTLGFVQWRSSQASAALATLERAARLAPQMALVRAHLAAVRKSAV